MKDITIVVKFSDSKIACFKANKQFSSVEMSNILFLSDEERFKKFLLKNKNIKVSFDRENVKIENHNSNYSDEVFFAPLTYGIIYIDFLKKEVYSNNGYSDFLEENLFEIHDLFNKHYKEKDFINQQNYNYTSKVNSFKNGDFALHTYPLFKKCNYPTNIFFNLLKNYLNKGEVVIRDSKRDTILRRYTGKDLEPISFIQSFMINYESFFEGLDSPNLSLALIPKDWNIKQGNSDPKEIAELYEKLSIGITFTQQEVLCWKEKS